MKTLKILTSTLLSCSLAFLLIACNSDEENFALTGNDNNKENAQKESYLPKTIAANGHFAANYTYDNQDRLQTVTREVNMYDVSKGTGIETTNIEYDNKGRIAKKTMEYIYGVDKEFKKQSVTMYTYLGNSIVAHTSTGSNVGKIPTTTTQTHVLNEMQQLVKTISDKNGMIDCEYSYDDKGNLIRKTEYEKVVGEHNKWMTASYRYEYDNKNGVFSNVNAPQWFKITESNLFGECAVNNCIGKTYNDFDGMKENYCQNCPMSRSNYNEYNYPTQINFGTMAQPAKVTYHKN